VSKRILYGLIVAAAVLLVMGPVLGAPETEAASEPSNHGWLSVIPPILAIGLALITRQVVVALVLGVYIGAVIIAGNPFEGFLRVGDTYLVGALADKSHAAIVLFSTILGGMVGVLSGSGATEGIVHWLKGRVGTRKGGQTSTAVMGTLIFFDDYANTLLVGATMRPFTDRLRISREKLAWLVDSTAAPVATVAVISTWVGFEVGLIQEAMVRLDMDDRAYSFFLQSIPYSYYPLLTLLMVYLVALTGRDFGPMRQAEIRAAHKGEVLRPGAQPASDAPVVTEDSDDPANPWLAGVPILAVIMTTALGLYFGGRKAALAEGLANPSLRQILDNADSFAVLTWAALTGAVLAVALVVVSKRQSLVEALESYLEGARAMVEVMTDGASIDANHRDRIEVDSIDREDRMVQWLNQILYAAIVDGFVLANATIALRENGLTATVNGASNARDLIATELKSVTYHDLHLDNHPHGWYARVVIDV
jgi:Na+/H+ antiporter NhaC